MDVRNKHCMRMTFFVIIACVAMGAALAYTTISRLTGWDYMSFGIIAAIVTGVSFTFAAIEPVEYQFDWREKRDE